jgi:predicted nucleic acid-binding protein
VIVLDTTVLIDVLRGHRPAVEYLRSLDDVPVCSELTRTEIMRGLRRPEHDATEVLMRTLRWVPVDEVIARRAGRLGQQWRKSHALSTVDLVIAATAQELDAGLATSNTRHYPMFSGLRRPYLP